MLLKYDEEKRRKKKEMMMKKKTKNIIILRYGYGYFYCVSINSSKSIFFVQNNKCRLPTRLNKITTERGGINRID